MFGISEYVCRHRGFTGDIKQHVDDFRVWEIQDGLTLEITNSVIPKALYRSDETGSKRARLNVDGKDTAEHTAPSANDALEEVEAAALDVDFQVWRRCQGRLGAGAAHCLCLTIPKFCGLFDSTGVIQQRRVSISSLLRGNVRNAQWISGCHIREAPSVVGNGGGCPAFLTHQCRPYRYLLSSRAPSWLPWGPSTSRRRT